MRTLKRNIIILDEGDTIEIQANGRHFIVTLDSDRHATGPTIDLQDGAELVIEFLGDTPVNEYQLHKNSTIFI